VDKGISEIEVEDRIKKYGSNTFPVRESKSFFELVKEALNDTTMIILCICAFISIVINIFVEGIFPIEGVAILTAVSACTLVAATNDYQKEKQFIELQKVAEDKKKVIFLERLP
jgi:magnesium-transporting ATPase (P-type)